jgi:spermidine synthase
MSKDKTKKIYLLVLAFTSGLTIMAVEITASRLIAPYFGTSTFIWTNIIGVIMVALSIGYYVGGKISDKLPDLKLLLEIILVACIILLVIPFIIQPIVGVVVDNILFLQSATIMIFLGSLITVSVLFIVPILLLGVVSPFIIKLLSTDEQRIGTDAGLVFSISTIGSIIGTFLPILVFIPYLGSRKTMISFALLLLFVALIGLVNKKWHLIFFVLLLPVVLLNLSIMKPVQGFVYEDESAYQYFQIADEGYLRMLKPNEGLGVASVYNLNDESVLTGFYYDYYNILPGIVNKKDLNILVLGLAGGTISTQLDHFFSDSYNLNIDGVEIDQKIIEASKEYFDIENPSLNIYNFDGRTFLNYSDKKYDIIIIDVYSNQLYISFHLTTLEFFNSIKKNLNEGGLIAMNVNATSKESPILKNITNTMLKVFNNINYISEGEDDWNFTVIASDEYFDFTNLENSNNIPELEPIIRKALKYFDKVEYDNNFGYLTDDKAPIEHYTDWMGLDYIFNKMN